MAAPLRWILLAALGVGCAVPAATPLAPGLKSPFTGYSSPLYREDRMWLCRPDRPGDACKGDLTATAIRPDGTRVVEKHVAAAAPDVDCFYVYPTVDLGIVPGNHTDFADRDAIVQTTLAQAARFDEVCAVYVPFYRQATIGSYVLGQREPRLAVAFSDVQDAFLHYLGQYNHGRRIVLIGHSQGADMVMRLLARWFDGDDALRARLVVALAIGGPVTVRHGRTTGRALANIPICTRADQTGCVVGYHSFRATGHSLPDATADDPFGEQNACVDPAAVGAPGWHRLSAAYFPTRASFLPALHGVEGVTTPYLVVRDRYYAACVDDRGVGQLLVAEAPAPGDVRQPAMDLDAPTLRTGLGLHVLDVQLALGDLIELVRRRIAPGQ